MENKPRILVVEEDTRLRETLSFILTCRGYDVTTAKDGAEAIARVKERPFDLTFMDSKMFVVNGVETYKTIKKIRPEAEVVVITNANAPQGPVKQAIRENAWGPLFKPLKAEKLCDLIEESRRIKAASFIPVFDCEPEPAPAS